jgi:hypothetical protein
MNRPATPFKQTAVVVSKALWTRALPDGSVNGIGNGPQAKKAIDLVLRDSRGSCIMGFVGEQALGILAERMQGVGFLSNLGNSSFTQLVRSEDGETIPLEREIARLNDRRAPYERVSEDFVMERISGLLAMAGVNVIFED